MLTSTRANKYRNYACPCQSGKKYKRCCYQKDQAAIAEDENVQPEPNPDDNS